ncbi:MAG: hypothetical protein MUF64_31215 [Polyangiaceae bacterium]|jgi:hypothetical protein|nr:hypothetical protein [Polyangiaceae bacterium]
MRSLLALLALGALAAPTTALAQPSPDAPHPFRDLAGIGVHGATVRGDYDGVGLGGRIRVEPWRRLGVDLFGEILRLQVPRGTRLDVPLGFHLYTPLPLSEDLRLRPFLGMCVAGSSIHPEERDAPRADDVLGGVLGGMGLDLAVHEHISLFVEAKAVLWLGHDRTVQRWTGAVDNEARLFTIGQAQLGVMVHPGWLR